MRAACVALGVAWLAACGSAPPAPSTSEAPVSVPVAPAAKATADQSEVARAAPADPATVNAAVPLDIPPRAQADFDRAVNLMRAGDATEAELEFKQIGETYPRFAAPYVNLGLLYRKAGRLDHAEEALATATSRNASSAVAWNELGVTRRMRGRFEEAGQAYERAIAVDDSFAPAHRNYGVLLDLYLAQPERALMELERYKELSGEDKPVSGWIAELRQRTGKKAPPAPQREQAQQAEPAAQSEAVPSAQPESAPPPSDARGG